MLLENEQKKLPKITGWAKSTPLDEVNKIPLELGENKDEASIDSEASIKASNEAPSSEPVTSVSTSVAVSTNEPIASSSTSVTVGGKISDSTLEKNQTVKLTYENDIGLWPEHLSEDFRSYWIEKGSAKCRNYVGSDFKNSAVKDGEKLAIVQEAFLLESTHYLGKILILDGYVTQKRLAVFFALHAALCHKQNQNLPLVLKTGNMQGRPLKVIVTLKCINIH